LPKRGNKTTNRLITSVEVASKDIVLAKKATTIALRSEFAA